MSSVVWIRLAKAAPLGLIALAMAACGTTNPTLLGVDYPVRTASAPSATPPSTSPDRQPGGAGRYKVGSPYQVNGRWYTPAEDPRYNETGLASWYGDPYHGRPTANGEIFDMNLVSAAHTTLPMPSLVEVTNLDNGQRIVVRVNDRGPFVEGRIIDLSRGAADELGVRAAGLARVRVRYVGPAPLNPTEDHTLRPGRVERAGR